MICLFWNVSKSPTVKKISAGGMHDPKLKKETIVVMNTDVISQCTSGSAALPTSSVSSTSDPPSSVHTNPSEELPLSTFAGPMHDPKLKKQPIVVMKTGNNSKTTEQRSAFDIGF
ncbi:hypothetical protein ONE63_010339 [Megalurothrips usitatus]|uniref:Uncharacterized protein n=1 Tax=Megalurothrips usitatus TaxID=439358 RepID=A0AAV7XM92_9NEOP|nr:hypothetical protein ONE63_010339 [Megalurothrips usitatus]